jgi:hypothetical protein
MPPETPQELQQPNFNQPSTIPQSPNPSAIPPYQPQQYTQSQNPPSESPTPKKSTLKYTIIAAILILLIAVAGYEYYQSKNKSTAIGGSVSLNGSTSSSYCIPIITTNLDKSSATSAYKNFAKAVSTKNQTCADDQSSIFFLSYAKQEFGAPDGKWITAKPSGLRPISVDFAQLPSSLSDASFRQSDYTRPIVAARLSNSSINVTGTTLSYAVDLSKLTGDSSEKWQISISFVLENGNVKVDNVAEEPLQ